MKNIENMCVFDNVKKDQIENEFHAYESDDRNELEYSEDVITDLKMNDIVTDTDELFNKKNHRTDVYSDTEDLCYFCVFFISELTLQFQKSRTCLLKLLKLLCTLVLLT